MPSKRFDRWKYLEEWLGGKVVPGREFTIRMETDVPYDQETLADGSVQVYTHDEYVVEWED